MGILKKDGFITIDQNGYIELTKKGETIASNIYERHIFLCDFLKSIGVSEIVASKDACKIEHHLSEETFTKLKEFVSTWKQNA